MKPVRKRWVIVGVVAALAIGSIAAVAVQIRMDTGEWRVPDKQDFVRVAQKVTHNASHTIFLEKKPVDLKPGDDDAPAGYSSILLSARNRPVHTHGWNGG